VFKISWLTDTRRAKRPSAGEKAHYRDVDGRLCAYCEKEVELADSDIAHLCPLTKRGADADENKAISHKKCNQFAKHRVPQYCEDVRVRRFRARKVRGIITYATRSGGFVPVFEFEDG
jgi:5-methylcytosine-specific restriction endonuclease McrA